MSDKDDIFIPLGMKLVRKKLTNAKCDVWLEWFWRVAVLVLLLSLLILGWMNGVLSYAPGGRYEESKTNNVQRNSHGSSGKVDKKVGKGSLSKSRGSGIKGLCAM